MFQPSAPRIETRRTPPTASVRAWGAAAAVTIAVASGCSSGHESAPAASAPPRPAPTSEPTSDAAGSGVVAEPASTALPVEARDIRVVRLGGHEVALQFELYNGTDDAVEPYDLGMGLIERNLELVDLPRATMYGVVGDGLNGRVSDNQYDDIAPGAATTVTAVFTAPPQETTSLWFLTNALMPVEVPVEPAGSASLKDDPVLTGSGGSDPYVDPLMCAKFGPDTSGTERSVEIKLPSDVLFEFGRSELTAAAQSALDGAADQVGASSGTVTVEGHTDAIGDDASNQSLSEARAASVQAALQERLGSGFTFSPVGFGESRPVAPNTRPDGSDDPDGRAQNRRVEIRAGDATAVAPPELEPRDVANDIGAKGATAEVDSVQRVDGHLLATVTMTNPTQTAIEVGPGSGLTDVNHRPLGITVADTISQRRAEVCRNSDGESLEGFSHLSGPPSNDYAPNTSNELPPGASVHLWAFYTAPPADVTSVDVEIGGLGSVQPSPIAG